MPYIIIYGKKSSLSYVHKVFSSIKICDEYINPGDTKSILQNRYGEVKC